LPRQTTYLATDTQVDHPKAELNTQLSPSLQPSQQRTNFPTFRAIHTIIGVSNLDFQNKQHKQEYYRQVNHVMVEGPVMRTKWSHLTFIEADIKLVSFPHTYVMVITRHIDKWDVTRVIIDNDSQAKFLFLSTFDQMGLDRKQLKEAMKSLHGFGRRRIELVGSIPLLVSFGSLQNM
jgi:hypothetical protein